MNLVKITTDEQAEIINTSLRNEPKYEDTHPFFVNKLSYPHQNFYLLYLKDHLVGMAQLLDLTEGEAEIHKLYIFSSQRGNGTGRVAVQSIINFFRELKYNRLNIEVASLNVIPFWEKMGFVSISPEFPDGRNFAMDI